jgi:pectinesterase
LSQPTAAATSPRFRQPSTPPRRKAPRLLLSKLETEYAGIIRHYLEDCFVRGDIDFIFGSATVVFNRCEIFSNSRGEAVNGYITAASTSPAYSFGYVFVDCRLSGDAGPHSVYLGRPWRDHAHVAFINCWMGEHIIPAGWHNWDKPHREQTVKYLEFGSTGPGASDQSRVSWSKILTPDDAKAYSVQNVLAGPDGWRPWR